MDAVVICGGKGTRVSSITKDEIPKILIPLYDDKYKRTHPFLEYLVENLYRNGVRRMTLAAGFKAEVLKDYLNKRGYYSWINPWMDIQIVEEEESLDTCGAVINTLGISAGPHSEPFLVINGDSLILPNGEDNYEELYYESPFYSNCAIFTCKKTHDGRYGNIIREPGSWIDGFESNKPGTGYINCGWYIFRREFFDRYRDPKDHQRYLAERLSFEKDVFPQRLEEGDTFCPIIVDEKNFLEIGTPEALELAEEKIKLEF